MTTISFEHKGDFSKTEKFLNAMKDLYLTDIFDKYGQMGVDALRDATPKKTGKTASSWRYEITRDKGTTTISWHNDNVVDHVNIAVILDTGHGTGTGGYVRGTGYIEPALKKVFEGIADKAWEEVTSK